MNLFTRISLICITVCKMPMPTFLFTDDEYDNVEKERGYVSDNTYSFGLMRW